VAPPRIELGTHGLKVRCINNPMFNIIIYNTTDIKIKTLINKPIPAGHHEVEFNG